MSMVGVNLSLSNLSTKLKGASGGDPSFSSVISLLHFNGTAGSNVYPDEIGNTVTPNTGASITTASGFGGAEALYDDTASGPVISLGTNGLLGTVWTIESFITPIELNGRYLFNLRATDNLNYMYLQINTNGSVTGFYLAAALTASAAGVVVSGNRQHFAVCQNGAVLRVFVNGLLASTSTPSGTYPTGTVSFCPGMVHNLSFGGYRYKGKLDELRITKGVARYTTSFTPPTEQFPDS